MNDPEPINNPPPEVVPQPVVSQPVPEKELLHWQAPSRLYKKRTREFYTTVAAIVFLLSAILFFAKEFLLIGVILALGFLAYALASVPPETVEHVITTKGIRTSGQLFLYPTLGRYWWDERWNTPFVTIETPGRIPPVLVLLQGEADRAVLDNILKTYLINQKPLPNWFDKASKWLTDRIPLESTS